MSVGHNVESSVAQSGGGSSYHGPETTSFSDLVDNIAPSALYNTAEITDPGKCHPGTRLAVLQRLESRLNRDSNPKTPITWLIGQAGAGKSAIMRTLCERLDEKKDLLASFFFFRTSPARNTVDRFVPTLTHQFCQAIPALRPLVEDCIRADPRIFSQDLQTQTKRLLIDPICTLYAADQLPDPGKPWGIVIDGLDECHTSQMRRQTLEMIGRLVTSLPIPLHVFVASRSHQDIRQLFEDTQLKLTTKTIQETLNNESDTDADIRRLFEDRFRRIVETHPRRQDLNLVGGLWPSSSLIDRLVKKASGQFIFAETIIRFIEHHIINPDIQLQIILLALHSEKVEPSKQLDALYLGILKSLGPHEWERRQKVLSLISPAPFSLGPITTLTPAFIEKVLGWPSGECRRLLLGLESVLTLRDDNLPVAFFHKSWVEFLEDPARSEGFCVSRSFTYSIVLSAFIAADFWYQDEEIRRFEKTQFQNLLNGAGHTGPVTNAIKTIDFEEMERRVEALKPSKSNHASHTWIHICNAFLLALRYSKYPNRIELYDAIFPSFASIARRRVQTIYFDRPELGIILFASSPSYFGATPPPYNRHLPSSIVDLEHEKGFSVLSGEYITSPLANIITEMLASGPGLEVRPGGTSVTAWRSKAFQGVLERLMSSGRLSEDPGLISAILLESQLFSEKHRRFRKKGSMRLSDGLEAFATCPDLAETLRDFLDVFAVHLDVDNREGIDAYLQRVSRDTDVHPVAAVWSHLTAAGAYIAELLDAPLGSQS